MTLIRAILAFDAFMIELGNRVANRVIGVSSTPRLG